MSTHYLPIFQSNALSELDELIPMVINKQADFQTIFNCCKQYRLYGIASLFLSCDVPKFIMALHKSGQVYSVFLRQANDAEKITSKAGPFFDAIASGDSATAKEITINARKTWHKDVEYKDDFLYIFFLMKLFYLGYAENECESILKVYESMLVEDDPRLEYCQGLLHKDSEKCNESLRDILTNYESHYNELIRSESSLPEETATEGKLCVEGLALIKLAEIRGMSLDSDYLYIPSTARLRSDVIFHDDDWKEA